MKKVIGQLAVGALFGVIAAAVDALPLSFTVDARLNSSSGGTGVDTGIDLAAGEFFTFEASPDDLWSAGPMPRWSNADGLVGNLYATGSDGSGQSMGTLIGRSYGLHTQEGYTFVYGALVGEISGTYFLLGTDFSGFAPDAGTLNLFYWDVNQYDNQGSIVATIGRPTLVTTQEFSELAVQGIPEPGTFLLTSLALAGLTLRRRVRAS